MASVTWDCSTEPPRLILDGLPPPPALAGAGMPPFSGPIDIDDFVFDAAPPAFLRRADPPPPPARRDAASFWLGCLTGATTVGFAVLIAVIVGGTR